MRRHMGRLNHFVPGGEQPLGHDGTIRSGALDDDQCRCAVEPLVQPAQGPRQPRCRCGELATVEHRAGFPGDEGKGVGGGVGVHADDKCVLL